ncbi:hypothetical protein P154DRAFT_584147 [Amniculicola lignicola CBS 123094]|uniref:Uncharacterized protein n=1 Tax=Amniculicola lignicola CBS 123094 TaxID=1392246 RepID=A0A6A5X4U1_9PLEO|nr:hypothetical protein P154DRAFT_584147 [Amniculicola lignicola CBS 123094]
MQLRSTANEPSGPAPNGDPSPNILAWGNHGSKSIVVYPSEVIDVDKIEDFAITSFNDASEEYILDAGGYIGIRFHHHGIEGIQWLPAREPRISAWKMKIAKDIPHIQDSANRYDRAISTPLWRIMAFSERKECQGEPLYLATWSTFACSKDLFRTLQEFELSPRIIHEHGNGSVIVELLPTWVRADDIKDHERWALARYLKTLEKQLSVSLDLPESSRSTEQYESTRMDQESVSHDGYEMEEDRDMANDDPVHDFTISQNGDEMEPDNSVASEGTRRSARPRQQTSRSGMVLWSSPDIEEDVIATFEGLWEETQRFWVGIEHIRNQKTDPWFEEFNSCLDEVYNEGGLAQGAALYLLENWDQIQDDTHRNMTEELDKESLRQFKTFRLHLERMVAYEAVYEAVFENRWTQ